MAFRRSDLQEAFFVPGTHAFRVWGYGTADLLEEVLAPNYFRAAGELRPGELIDVSTTPSPADAGGPEQGEPRLALVMVRSDERGGASVRLVQDFGGPNDPSAPLNALCPQSKRSPSRRRRCRSSAVAVARPGAATRGGRELRNGCRSQRIPGLEPTAPECLITFVPRRMLTT